MKVGAESRGKLIAGVSLAAVALIVVTGSFSGWFGMSSTAAAPSPSASTATANDPVPVPARTTPGRRSAAKKASAERSLDPSLRLDLLKSSEETKYEGNGRNIFAAFVEIPKVVQNPVKSQPTQVVQQGPPPPPPPAPIPLTFYGFATPSGGAKRIFLVAHDSEDVFIAKEGDIVDRRYKVVRISPNAVEILDVLSNNRQSIPLTQG